MAEDDGTGRQVYGPPLPVYGPPVPKPPSSMDTLWNVNPQQAMLVEAETLANFRKKADQILTKLLGSQASPKQLADEKLVRDELGGGQSAFIEAQELFGAYESVVVQLKQLSKMLSDSVDGLSIAIQASQSGYEEMDDDVKRRMRALNQRTGEWAREHAKDQPVDQGADT
ncbi:hypothetical protein OHA61_24085 [Streptomyces sp. NBC_00885]|uniref:hypothetical protein n=1 Tax=Streptomyces sp. NBC_00885 TaxID=2975857 RepID=UPI0038676C9C|nr:hypothetical protein OHA61_24085 [Streptomyces sp. NBC_00885]